MAVGCGASGVASLLHRKIRDSWTTVRGAASASPISARILCAAACQVTERAYRRFFLFAQVRCAPRQLYLASLREEAVEVIVLSPSLFILRERFGLRASGDVRPYPRTPNVRSAQLAERGRKPGVSTLFRTGAQNSIHLTHPIQGTSPSTALRETLTGTAQEGRRRGRAATALASACAPGPAARRRRALAARRAKRQ